MLQWSAMSAETARTSHDLRWYEMSVVMCDTGGALLWEELEFGEVQSENWAAHKSHATPSQKPSCDD